jgi:hypothetical protein
MLGTFVPQKTFTSTLPQLGDDMPYSHHAFVLTSILGMSGFAQSAYSDCLWVPVIQYLAAQQDDRSHRAAENLSTICTDVSLKDMQQSETAKKCIHRPAKIFSDIDKTILAKTLGTVPTSTLRLLFPTVATLLSRPAVGAVGLFLLPEAIGEDPIDRCSEQSFLENERAVNARSTIIGLEHSARSISYTVIWCTKSGGSGLYHRRVGKLVAPV